MNPEETFEVLLTFLSSRKKELSIIQQDILLGTFNNMTYEAMQLKYGNLRYRSIETIKKIDAPKLWNYLTEILAGAKILDKTKEKVGKKNLRTIIERGLLGQSESKTIIKGQYEVIQTLQENELETIYVAYNLYLPDKPKCIIKQLQNPSDFSIVKLEKEAITLRNLGEKNNYIPQLFAYFQDKDLFYLIFEYIEGKTIAEELATSPWSETKVKNFIEEVLQILKSIHERNIIHRSIAPLNLVRRHIDRKIALVNFDTVKCLNIDSTIASKIIINQYTAPELLIAPQYSSDLYSLGKMAIQLLTGLPPKQLQVEPKTLDIILPESIEVSASFAAIVQKMTCFHFMHRYQSAQEILEIL